MWNYNTHQISCISWNLKVKIINLHFDHALWSWEGEWLISNCHLQANNDDDTTINARTVSSLAPLQLKHHLQALLPEQIPIALQQTTLEEASQIFTNTKNWARGGKASGQGVRGDYKGKAENYDPDYHERLQTNHINGQQQQGQAIMPPPYMYQPQDLIS